MYTTCFHCLMLCSWGPSLLHTAAIYSLDWWIAFYYVNSPRFVFLVYSEWICGLFLVFGYQEQCCCKCPCTGPHVQAFLRVTLLGHRTCASSTLPDNSKLFCKVVSTPTSSAWEPMWLRTPHAVLSYLFWAMRLLVSGITLWI